MGEYPLGLLLGLSVAFFWTGSSLCFQQAGRRVGSLPVNLIRMVIAMLGLGVVCLINGHGFVPLDATAHQWKWLLISGFVGFFIGDLPLFRAFVLIGARLSTLVMSLAPPFAAVTGFFLLGESLSLIQAAGMFVTLAGVAWVVLERQTPRPTQAVTSHDVEEFPPPTNVDVHRKGFAVGVIMALIGAAAQGVSVVLTKRAYVDGEIDSFAATQIRVLAGVPCFLLAVAFAGRMRDTIKATRDVRAMWFTTIGAILGPFVGVSVLNASVKHIPAALSQTLAAMVPVVMLPFAATIGRERVGPRAVIGAVVAVAGVAMLGLSETLADWLSI